MNDSIWDLFALIFIVMVFSTVFTDKLFHGFMRNMGRGCKVFMEALNLDVPQEGEKSRSAETNAPKKSSPGENSL